MEIYKNYFIIGIGGGAIVFENETTLEFSRQFLSVSISTNRAIYTGGMTMEIRAIMLTTSNHPYNGIADLFILDPDGYIIRKWNSKVSVPLKKLDNIIYIPLCYVV